MSYTTDPCERWEKLGYGRAAILYRRTQVILEASRQLPAHRRVPHAAFLSGLWWKLLSAQPARILMCLPYLSRIENGASAEGLYAPSEFHVEGFSAGSYTRPSRNRRSADLDLPASEPPVPLKNTAFRAFAISPQRILYCACHEICAWRFPKCCACKEICTWRYTKCCACHEILHLPRNLHMEVHKVLRLPRNLHFKKQVKTLTPMEGRFRPCPRMIRG